MMALSIFINDISFVQMALVVYFIFQNGALHFENVTLFIQRSGDNIR